MAPLGGVIVHDRVAEPFINGTAFYNHGVTYSGHPVSAAIASKVIDIYERENVLDNVRANEIFLRDRLDELRRIPLVGDVRGAGHFFAIELVKDRGTKETFEGAEADWLLREVLSARMYESGLLCRLDDRGDPVVQLSPPLIADQAGPGPHRQHHRRRHRARLGQGRGRRARASSGIVRQTALRPAVGDGGPEAFIGVSADGGLRQRHLDGGGVAASDVLDRHGAARLDGADGRDQ